MQRTYWILFIFTIVGLIFSFGCVLLFAISYVKKRVSIRVFVGFVIAMTFLFIICFRMFIPLLKDFDMVRHKEYVEEIGIVVEFTEVYRSVDGNGEIMYSKPKFYISDKNKYIVLHLANVELGKKYRIKYYPNSKIAEAVLIE